MKKGYWKHTESFQSQFEVHIENPIDGLEGKCPLCGKYGTYKPQGKAKKEFCRIEYAFTASRYKETGVIIRYIKLGKIWELKEQICDNEELVMTGAREKLEGVEIARTYFIDSRNPQTDYCKYNPFDGKDFWDDCNLSGMSNILVKETFLLPEFEQTLKGTILQYSAIGLYAAENGKVNAKDYLERYQKTPQIEILVKLKLYGIVESLVDHRYGIVADINARRPDQFLGIRQDRLKLLINRKGSLNLLKVLQIEKRMEQNWTEEQIKALEETEAEQHQIELAMSIMTLQKALNNIKKYAGCEYGTECGDAAAKIRCTAAIYFDYLSMRIQRGYDMTNTIYQKPRDLRTAHNKMVEEINKDKQDARIREVEIAYPMIRKNYRKLRNRYLYQDKEYIIRPARSAKEIVEEGRILHHCVGGNNYLDRHNSQKSIILMLRYRKEPEMPYITVEIQEDKIVQWYGEYDKKPDEENMQKWLNGYVTQLKNRHPLKGLRELDFMEVI